MADIDIQKKEGPPILPIILGVLVVAAIIAAVWYFMSDDNDRTATQPGMLPHDTAAEQFGTQTTPMAVTTFRNQCGDAAGTGQTVGATGQAGTGQAGTTQPATTQPGTTQPAATQPGTGQAAGAGAQHEADCMRQLADALEAVMTRDATPDASLRQRVESLRQDADRMTQDAAAADNANQVRTAAMEATNVMEQVAQQRQGTGADAQQHVQRMREAAQQIEAATPLQQQRERTSQFFSHAASALEAMTRNQQAQPR